MKLNTPPRSPNPGSEEDNNEEMDLGDIEEIIELNQDSDLDEELEEDGEGAENIADMAAVVFSKHKGSIFRCRTSPDGKLVATGGEDDLAYVWDITTGSILLTCTGHKDSVTEVCFSHDGTLLATADYGGLIQVWKLSTSAKIWEFETGDLGWLTWHPGSHVLLAGTQEGEMWMWLVPQGNTRTFPSFGTPSQFGAFMKDGKRAVAGYDDGWVRLFDLKTGQVVSQWSAEKNSASSVVSLDTHIDNTLIIVGFEDGEARLLNANSGKVVGCFNCAIPSEEEMESNHTVEGISFSPSNVNILATATLAGFVTIWDISSQVSRHVVDQKCGSSRLVWHPSEDVLFSAGLDGVVRSYDSRSGDLMAQYTGHGQCVLDIDVTRDGSRLVSASDDGTARVFKLS